MTTDFIMRIDRLVCRKLMDLDIDIDLKKLAYTGSIAFRLQDIFDRPDDEMGDVDILLPEMELKRLLNKHGRDLMVDTSSEGVDSVVFNILDTESQRFIRVDCYPLGDDEEIFTTATKNSYTTDVAIIRYANCKKAAHRKMGYLTKRISSLQNGFELSPSALKSFTKHLIDLNEFVKFWGHKKSLDLFKDFRKNSHYTL